jgi:hypothetical protein
MLKQQPLMIAMSNESLEGEGQTKLQKERQSRSVICKSFLLGSSTGFASQAMSYAAYYTLLKMFGKDTTPEPGSLLSWFSYCLLVLMSHPYTLIYIVIWLRAVVYVIYSRTKSGVLYHRKKTDEMLNSDSSIWTTRTVFMVGGYFLFGLHAGAIFFLAIMNLCLGSSLMPLMTSFLYTMINFAICLFTVKCYCRDGRPVEQELGDEHSSVV